MKICSIIAEYNPFHNGHALQLEKTRAILGEDTAIVCIMSGNFVQRGDFAIMEKYLRAQTAAQCGADLIIELPLGAALSSAEGFARGAVQAMQALGTPIGYLSFGSESGSARAIMHAADALNQLEGSRAFHAHLEKGHSYAAACQHALETRDPVAAALLSLPNNTLGIAYCRELLRSGSLISPIAIPRQGAAHDSLTPASATASASLLRSRIAEGRPDECKPYMPAQSYSLLEQAILRQDAPVCAAALDRAMVSYLRRLSAEDLAQYENPDEGLCNRLRHALDEGGSFETICKHAATRRYPLARVRRALLRAYLNIPLQALCAPPEYLRVLAIGKQGRSLLRLFSQSAAVPLITKPLHEKNLPSQAAVQRDALADELYHLALPAADLPPAGSHFRKTPYCLPGAR